MSMQALTWALNLQTGSPSAKLVLLKLADQANDDGVCWPSLRLIERHTELSERAIRDQIRALEKMGFVNVEKRFKEGVRLPNIYHLNLRQTVGVGQELPGGGAPVAPGVGQELPGNSKPSIVNPNSTQESIDDGLASGEEPEGPALSWFKEFWEACPRKIDRTGAERAWLVALHKEPASELITAMRKYALAVMSTADQYVLSPANWLIRERWRDEIPEAEEMPSPERIAELQDKTDKILGRGKYDLLAKIRQA